VTVLGHDANAIWPVTTVMPMTNVRPLAAPSVSSYPLDDELVLYTPTDGQAYVLNHTAARIWHLLDGTRTEVAVARELADTYGEQYDDVLGDVRELVGHLRAVGLLVGEPDGA
jgi:PqqD family protein of HPr-rel-A system